MALPNSSAMSAMTLAMVAGEGVPRSEELEETEGVELVGVWSSPEGKLRNFKE